VIHGGICELAGTVRCHLPEEVAAARLQLTQYGAEMQRLAEEERRKSEQLQTANRKLREYALELQALVDKERRHAEEIQQPVSRRCDFSRWLPRSGTMKPVRTFSE